MFKSYLRTVSFLLVIFMAASLNLHAAPLETNDAEDILEKYIGAIGGREALKKIKTKQTETIMKEVDKKTEIKTTTFMARPNKVYSISEFKILGRTTTSEAGTNGNVVWEILPLKKRVLEGVEKERRLMDYAFDGSLTDWKKYFKTIKLAGEASINGKQCYKLIATPMDQQGDDMVYYFDKETFFLSKVEKEAIISGKTKKIELFLSDYKKVDELLIPYTVKRLSEDGKEFIITINDYKANVDIPENKFELPEKIKKKVEG